MTMNTAPPQSEQQELRLFEDDPPAALKPEVARHALDELFDLAHRYSTSKEYLDFLRFVARFRFYSPYNAMLIHCQMPGATFVAPPYRWRNQYRRLIRAGSRPLVILQPMGPVMFVFDVSDTYPEPGAPDLPKEVMHPFDVREGRVGDEPERTIENAKRDGVSITVHDGGSQYAGMIGPSMVGTRLKITVRTHPTYEHVWVPQRYNLLLNAKQPREVQYATMVHELAHLYCGHLGTPNEKWWPNRRRQGHAEREFEAESVGYLVCQRLGIDTPSAEYLSGYVEANTGTPSISLDCVLKAAGLIEQMGRSRLPLRKEKEPKS
jgi:hypothetical protein